MVSSISMPISKTDHVLHERFVDADEAATVLSVQPKTLQRGPGRELCPLIPSVKGGANTGAT